MDQCLEDDSVREDNNGAQQQSTRKSGREKRQRQSFSPDSATVTKKSKTSIKTSRKKKTKTTLPKPSPNTGFCCWMCQSPYVSDPLKSKHGSRNKKSRHNPSPKIHFDPVTNKTVEICNACALLFNPVKKSEPAPQLKPEEKEKLLSDAKNFGVCLAEELQDKDAERLYCSNLKSFSICGCIQKYLNEDREQRARNLLHFMKEARRLSKLKSYKNETDKKMYIGLGNGQKKSKEYENFVLHKREHIRHELKLCEIASKQILLYSNNFLHKNIKTEERRRMKRTKCKGKLNCLPEIATLHEKTCCVDNCVKVALTHSFLLHEWRSRAQLCQVEARRVLAEMLTPSGGYRCNCYKFIHWVTGCSNGTIHRVSSQMKATKGNREPPRHGLRKNWEFTSDNHNSINTSSDRDMNSSNLSSDSTENHSSIRRTSLVEVKMAAENEQDERLYQLQKQILDELAEKPHQRQQQQQQQQRHQSNSSDAPQNMQNMQILLDQLNQLQQSSLESSAVTMATRPPPTISSVPRLSHHSYSIRPTHQNTIGPVASAPPTPANPAHISVMNQFSPTGALIGNMNRFPSVQAQSTNPAFRQQPNSNYQSPNPAPAATLSSQSQNPPAALASKHSPPNLSSASVTRGFQNPPLPEEAPLKKPVGSGVTAGYSHNPSVSDIGSHPSLPSSFMTTSISVPAFHSAPIQLMNSANSKASQYLPNNGKTALIHENPVSVPHQMPSVGGGAQVSSYVSQIPSVLAKNTIQGFIGENGIVNFITQLPLDSCTFISSDTSTGPPPPPPIAPVAQAPTNGASVQILPFQPIQNPLAQTQNVVEPTYILTSPPATQLMSYNTQLQPDVQSAQTIVYQLPANFHTLPVQQRTTHVGAIDNQSGKAPTTYNQVNNVVTTCAQNSVNLGSQKTSNFPPPQTNQQQNHPKQNSVVASKPEDPKITTINNSKKKPEKKGVSKYRKIQSATEIQPPATLTDSLVGNSKSIHVIAHSTRKPPPISTCATVRNQAAVAKFTLTNNKRETACPKSKRPKLSNKKIVSNLATSESLENQIKRSNHITSGTVTQTPANTSVNPVVMPSGGASYETRVNLKQTIMDRNNTETQQVKQTIMDRSNTGTQLVKQTIMERNITETQQVKQTIVDRSNTGTQQVKQSIVERNQPEAQQVNSVKMSVEQPLKIRHKSGNHSAMQASLAPSSSTPVKSSIVRVSTPVSFSGCHYPATSHPSALVPVASPENDHVLSFINSDLDLSSMRSRNNSGEPTIDLSFTSLSASDLLQILSSQQDYTRTQLL